MYFDVLLGSTSITAKQLFNTLFFSDSTQTSLSVIIWEYRIPKMLTSLVVGLALPLSGLHMQTIFRNPLAGPFVLGISSGAGLGVALSMLLSTAFGVFTFTSFINVNSIVAGVIGAGLVMLLLLIVSEKVRNISSILIVGVMVGSLASSVISILQYYSNSDELKSYIIWTMGSIASVEWGEISILYIVTLLAFVFSLMLAKGLNAFTVGESYARTLGINVLKVRRSSLIISGVLTGITTSVLGPIAFIGLAVPHISKSILNTMNHQQLIPFTMLLGGVLMLVFDIVSHVIVPNQTIPINIITSMFGAPFVIYVVMRRKG